MIEPVIGQVFLFWKSARQSPHHSPQVVVSLVRAGLPVGHVCLIRDGSFEDSTETALHFDGDGRFDRLKAYVNV